MIDTKFINNKVALYTLSIGCFVVSVSMGIRQTYGIFFQFFETDLNITSTYFGLAIGVQAIVWGIFATIFGMIADKYGSNKVVMIALVTYAIGIYSLGNLNSQGFLFQINVWIRFRKYYTYVHKYNCRLIFSSIRYITSTCNLRINSTYLYFFTAIQIRRKKNIFLPKICRFLYA